MNAQVAVVASVLLALGCSSDPTPKPLPPMALLAKCWNQPATGGCAAADVNGDGVVDGGDLVAYHDLRAAGARER